MTKSALGSIIIGVQIATIAVLIQWVGSQYWSLWIAGIIVYLFNRR